jgi:hypothetical protein
VGTSDEAYAACDVAYQMLGWHAARVYRCLGVHSAPSFDLDMASKHTELGQDATAAALDELVDAGLLKREEGEQYRWEGVARRHALDAARRHGNTRAD